MIKLLKPMLIFGLIFIFIVPGVGANNLTLKDVLTDYLDYSTEIANSTKTAVFEVENLEENNRVLSSERNYIRALKYDQLTEINLKYTKLKKQLEEQSRKAKKETEKIKYQNELNLLKINKQREEDKVNYETDLQIQKLKFEVMKNEIEIIYIEKNHDDMDKIMRTITTILEPLKAEIK
jgi:hypothetical protein